MGDRNRDRKTEIEVRLWNEALNNPLLTHNVDSFVTEEKTKDSTNKKEKKKIKTSEYPKIHLWYSYFTTIQEIAEILPP